jgi:hypothetical protein
VTKSTGGKVVYLNGIRRCRICGRELDPRVYAGLDAHPWCKLVQPVGSHPKQ